MKICVISTPVFRLPCAGYSGLEHLAWQTAMGLAQKGHDVSLVAPDGSECPGVEIIPVGVAMTVDENMAYGGYHHIKEKVKQGEQEVEVLRRRAHPGYWQHLLKVDVIIDHSWQKNSYLLKEECMGKTPILGVLHAPVNTMYQTLPPVEKPCFVCISEDQGSHFEGLFGRPARVCHNGVDTDVYKSMNIPRTYRYLFLARFSSIKGPDLAIEACVKADVGLDLVGDTQITNEPVYLKKIKEMCTPPSIRMVGPATRAECVYWFSQAHCLLHPNQRFREPLGLAPLESLACGTPVIAWKHGAMKETIDHGHTGYLVESLEEMVERIKELTTDGISKNIREDCRQWVVNYFSIQRMVDRYEELCIEALDTGGW